MVNQLPKYIKFNYRNMERVWVRVIKIEGNYYYGYIDNITISKGIKKDQYVKVHKKNVIDKQ